jgi:hypothetical protein
MTQERTQTESSHPPQDRLTPPCPGGAFLERAVVWLRTGMVAAVFVVFGCFLYQVHVLALIPTWAWSDTVASGDQSNSWPGIRLPPTRAGDETGIDENEQVIGVCVAGHARAYLIRVMRRPMQHVVNDLLDGRPVSVTFCPRTQCTRVVTGPPSDEPLDIKIEGWKNDSLALHIGNEDYSQKTGENLTSPQGPRLPYPELPYQRTTWHDWRQAHPDSDIYVGDRSKS